MEQTEVDQKGEGNFGYSPGEVVTISDDATGEASGYTGESGSVAYKYKEHEGRIAMVLESEDWEMPVEITPDDIGMVLDG